MVSREVQITLARVRPCDSAASFAAWFAYTETGLIECNRGMIRIEDREGVESLACECYGRVRQMFRNLNETSQISAIAPMPGELPSAPCRGKTIVEAVPRRGEASLLRT